MWLRLTERARIVVFYGQEESTRLGANAVSAGHLLLGLLRDVEGHSVWPPPPADRVDPPEAAAWVLRDLGVDPKAMRGDMEQHLAVESPSSAKDKTLTRDARQVIDFAYDEARTLNCRYVGTEHLLLGLVRVKSSPSGRVLAQSGADLERVRQQVADMLRGNPPGTEPMEAKVAPEKKNLWSRLFGS